MKERHAVAGDRKGLNAASQTQIAQLELRDLWPRAEPVIGRRN
jgi:hypothetical protein